MKIIVLLFLSTSLFASGSRFGLVDKSKSLGIKNMQYSASGFGRSYEIAHIDSLQINFKNVSTLAQISKTTLSINTNYNAFFAENSFETTYSNNATFEGAFIGIPLKENMLSMALGLQPSSSINQKIKTITDTSGLSQDLILNGGLSKAQLSFSLKIKEAFYIGVGYEFTFGRIDEAAIFYENGDNLFNLNSENRVQSNGLAFSFFTNYYPNLNLGFVIKTPSKGNITRIIESVNSALNVPIESDITLPMELNFGAEYKINESYFTGIDFVYQDWEKGFKIDGDNIEGYNTFYYLGLGLERKGSPRKFVSYLQQIDLRTGFFYKNMGQSYNFKNVNEMGVSLGMSLPISKFRSKIDIAGYVSKRGDLSKHSLEETIVGLKFSISANELWFVNLED